MGARDAHETVCQDDREALGLVRAAGRGDRHPADPVDLSWETLLDARVQAMLAALAAVRGELGRLPTAAEWDRSGRRPSARRFGGGVSGGEWSSIGDAK